MKIVIFIIVILKSDIMEMVIFIIVILKSGILPLIILMSVILLLVAILSNLSNCHYVK